MKKIINGKRYDTETATKVGTWDNGCYGNNFNACTETLYCKKTGEYFLYGEGGALSNYAAISSDGNNRGWGEKIVPITEEKAREWAENNLDAEMYENWFDVKEEVGNGIASRLKAARGAETMASFSERFNIPRKTYENWEYGRTAPPIYVVEMIEKLANME